MSAIHLVRHGQASWGTDEYDRLSKRGLAQAAYLGQSWEAAGWLPTRAYAGTMRRHGQTAIATLDAAGPSEGYDTDPGWDEFDHEAVVAAHRPEFATTDPREFSDVFASSVRRWAGGRHDADYGETFAAFAERVLSALGRTVAALEPDQSAAVFTSGGPIAVVAAYLLSGQKGLREPAVRPLWARLNTVVINTGVTTVVTGRSGRTLLSFNEHTHLPADAVTYR